MALCENTLSGQVVAAYGRRFQVHTADGAIVECVAKGKRGGIACGDRVALRPLNSGQALIEGVLPRSTLFYRSDQFREKLIAANVTQVILVVAAVPGFSEELVNRCLVAAESQDIPALIVLNKADLPETARARQTLDLYRSLGYPLLELSARRDASPVSGLLRGHVSVLVGQSGMGKSTLINALLPGAGAATAEISTALDSGKHTTSHTHMYRLGPDSRLIDSPGMQEFGLRHVPQDAFAPAFREFRPHLGRCRFYNCRHLEEPDCALEQALRDGTVSERRLRFYRMLMRERLAQSSKGRET